jgi:hypothetical protein
MKDDNSLWVDVGGGLVENEYLVPPEDGPPQADQLTLANTKVTPSLRYLFHINYHFLVAMGMGKYNFHGQYKLKFIVFMRIYFPWLPLPWEWGKCVSVLTCVSSP